MRVRVRGLALMLDQPQQPVAAGEPAALEGWVGAVNRTKGTLGLCRSWPPSWASPGRCAALELQLLPQLGAAEGLLRRQRAQRWRHVGMRGRGLLLRRARFLSIPCCCCRSQFCRGRLLAAGGHRRRALLYLHGLAAVLQLLRLWRQRRRQRGLLLRKRSTCVRLLCLVAHFRRRRAGCLPLGWPLRCAGLISLPLLLWRPGRRTGCGEPLEQLLKREQTLQAQRGGNGKSMSKTAPCTLLVPQALCRSEAGRRQTRAVGPPHSGPPRHTLPSPLTSMAEVRKAMPARRRVALLHPTSSVPAPAAASLRLLPLSWGAGRGAGTPAASLMTACKPNSLQCRDQLLVWLEAAVQQEGSQLASPPEGPRSISSCPWRF